MLSSYMKLIYCIIGSIHLFSYFKSKLNEYKYV